VQSITGLPPRRVFSPSAFGGFFRRGLGRVPWPFSFPSSKKARMWFRAGVASVLHDGCARQLYRKPKITTNPMSKEIDWLCFLLLLLAFGFCAFAFGFWLCFWLFGFLALAFWGIYRLATATANANRQPPTRNRQPPTPTANRRYPPMT